MSSAAVSRRFTPEEYLALERKAEFKSEYHNGLIYAMSGASREHNRVSINLAIEIGQRLKAGPCEAFTSDMRVCVATTGRYYYPDLSIACGSPEFADGEFDTLMNPTVVFEILSPSTESYDRGEKFENYRRISSLQQYILVSEGRVLVERYTREDGGWTILFMDRLDDILRLDAVGVEVPLRDIYDRVDVPEGPGSG